MTSERDLLRYSLPPEGGAGWKEFEAAFPARKPGCPLTAELIELAQGLADAETAARLHLHTVACASCRTLLETYRRVGDDDRAADTPQGATVDEPNSVVLTGIFTMLLAGRTEEALRLLQPYLPDVLAAVGLDPALAGRLWEYLRQKLRTESQAAQTSCPEWLRDFAREALHRDDLPRRPKAEDWKPVIARCALRKVQSSPEETDDVRHLLQTAIDRGVTNPSYLDFLRLSGGPAVSGEECRRVIRKVSREEKRVASLFGLN
jgi:hypothetical protein